MSEETIPQMRERIEALSKQVKDAEKASREAQDKARLYEARDVFREAGYNPKHADLFVKSHDGDITAEAVGGFAGEYGLAPATASTSEESSPEQSETGKDEDPGKDLSPFNRAGSGAGEGGAATANDNLMTRDEWEDLNRRDPNAARAALQRGRVQIRKDNPWVSR